MDFKLSEDQELMRDMFREFAESAVKPLAAELDEQERFPEELIINAHIEDLYRTFESKKAQRDALGIG